MDKQNSRNEFELTTDKSLIVSSFLAIILFVVLFSIVYIINRNESYNQTATQVEESNKIE